MSDTLLAVALVATSFVIALAALIAFAYFDRRKTPALGAQALADKHAIVFLFENEYLLDASADAYTLLETGDRSGSDWANLTDILRSRFPDLAERMAELADIGSLSLPAEDGTARIEAEWLGSCARLTLLDEEGVDRAGLLDRHSLSALQNELETLRATTEHVPYLTWRERADGEITWANRAYLDLAETLYSDTIVQPWPPMRLFDFPPPDGENSGEPLAPLRVALSVSENDSRRWFEISQSRIGDDRVLTAIPADDVVRAENTLSEFIATLTKTFAHLPIGLAIFDRSRELTLFNPALTDLTLLPADFLCARPSLFAFLDRLREKRMMPEPKNYKSWRHQMADLEAKAVNGTYEETWALPTGQTYRVTGRPHPDGAVAFLFEDISAEVSLTRRFRSELELGQAALDALPEAVAIFAPDGVLTMSNRAYARLWGTDPSTSLSQINVSDATADWHQKCAPSPAWRKLRGFVHGSGKREEWSAPVALKDGRMLNCRVVPTAQGSTLVSFGETLSETARIEASPPLATAEI